MKTKQSSPRKKSGVQKGTVIVTRQNIALLDRLMTGKYLQRSIGAASRKEIYKKEDIRDVDLALKKLEETGIIAGYIPVLSEEGERVISAMRTMYDVADNGSSDSLVDILEE